MAEQRKKPKKKFDVIKSLDIDINEIEKMAALGMDEKLIRQALGITQGEWEHDAMYSDRLARAIEKGRAKGIQFSTTCLAAAQRRGNVKAITYYLDNRDPENWSSKVKVDNTSSDKSMSPQTSINISTMSKDELSSIVDKVFNDN